MILTWPKGGKLHVGEAHHIWAMEIRTLCSREVKRDWCRVDILCGSRLRDEWKPIPEWCALCQDHAWWLAHRLNQATERDVFFMELL